MATGIEIVGIVLGALPLVIEGLGIYQRGVKKLKRSVTYDFSLKKLIRRVTEQKIFLEDNIEKLLGAACSDQPDTPTPIVADDFLQLISMPATAGAVRIYLGEERHSLFEEILQECDQCLKKLAGDLDTIQRASKKRSLKERFARLDTQSPTNSSKSEGHHLSKRVMYLIKEDVVISLTTELDSLNKSMDTLLANAAILHKQKSLRESRVIPDERKALAVAYVLNRIRSYTEQLFRAFHTALVPGCHSSHDIALFLDAPNLDFLKQPRTMSSSFKFSVMLAGSIADIGVDPTWHEADVTVRLNDHTARPNTPSAVSNIVSAPVSVPSISVTAPPTKTPLPQVRDLCGAALSASQASFCLDLLLEHDKSFIRNSEGRSRACNSSRRCDTINLQQLLSAQTRISPSEKVKLAFKLATALLQLKASQWLQTPFSNQAIYFRKSIMNNTYSLELDRPLVLQSFCHPIPVAAPESKPKVMFVELGILLLEIWNEKLFAAFAKESCQIDPIPPLMRQGLASAWYDSTWTTMTSRYGKVVQTCVNFAFDYDQSQQSWDDEDLRKSVCAKIICPLDEECRAFPS